MTNFPKQNIKPKIDKVEEELNQSGFENRNENRTCVNGLINQLFDGEDTYRKRPINLKGSKSPKKETNRLSSTQISPNKTSPIKINLDRIQSNNRKNYVIKFNQKKNIKDLINKNQE